jgi:high-affinity iron transporter
MLVAFLITLREVIEASFIIATIIGVLTRLKQTQAIKTVWLATAVSGVVSLLLVGGGSVLGLKMHELYTGTLEQLTEGILMLVSAVFITWAVFFLHEHFSKHKKPLVGHIEKASENEEQRGLFLLVFVAVLREGFEIALFLSTIYLSSQPQEILTGFIGGLVVGLLLAVILWATTSRLPLVQAFRLSNILLILFAAGLLARGIHELMEAHIIPEVFTFTLGFIPAEGSFWAHLFESIFGFTRQMDITQIIVYGVYVAGMSWWIRRKEESHKSKVKRQGVKS